MGFPAVAAVPLLIAKGESGDGQCRLDLLLSWSWAEYGLRRWNIYHFPPTDRDHPYPGS
ncbi:MAG: hypothetical protein CM15mP49_10900 [Actinomycetota bacterium]|nr:MAG: hypothetical protein CM15mP49_10900 [Actinomycetota bacterium]